MRLTEKQLLVALGANQNFGDISPDGLIAAALRDISTGLEADVQASGLFRTPCFPAGAGPDYVNAAALVTLRQTRAADQVLADLHAVEARFGRVRQVRWGARTLDIDLLAMGDVVLPDVQTHQYWRDLPAEAQQRQTPDQLILPHPRLQDRAFVLVPLADVAAEWRHPILGRSVDEMLDALPQADRDEVVRLTPVASA